jgi:Ca-activated chloride channel family protein
MEISEMVCSRQQLGSQAFDEDFGRGFGSFGGFSGFGGFGGGDPRRFLLLDEPTLQGVADITGGEYFRAENADQLLEVFLELPKQVIVQQENFELSVFLLALGGIFILTASVLSMKWNRFP